MDTYHQRRAEKAITEHAEMAAIIRSQKTMTLAMCKDNDPYLVTVNYGYDDAAGCLYFHCSRAGKKMAYLKANPQVWGQIVDDQGYLDGQCNHAFESVHFSGRVEFLEGDDERRQAIELMIDQLESDPAAVKQQQVTPSQLAKTALIRIHIHAMTGKRNPAR